MKTNTRKVLRGTVALAGSAIFAIGLAIPAMAFHEGGVAHCDGCHSMHNSENVVSGTENNLLLKGSDPSSTCLNCHSGGGGLSVMSTDASKFTPGGDFFWLTATYTNTVRGNPVTNDPDNTGHNVIASDYGLAVDGTNTQAPGGTFPASSLGCNSCHDPHGQVGGGTPGGQDPISVSGSYGGVPDPGTIAGNYRLLRDDTAVPVAAVNPNVGGNNASRFLDSPAAHPAYGTNVSEFCATCHGLFVNDNHKHPAGNGEFLNGQAAVYNSYVATGDFTGSQLTSYEHLVPFERQVTDKPTLLAAATSDEGPISGNENVMCLTCHRAHATAFENATRWDMGTELLADSTPNATNLSDIGAVPFANYYGRDIVAEFGQYQRSLCNKCHAQD